jgi:hypothetical protein
MLRLAAPSGGPRIPRGHAADPPFDTLALGREHGLRIAGLLGDHVGSVVVDPEAFTCTFFVAHHAGAPARNPRRTLGSSFPRPRKKTPPGPFWLTAPEGDRPVLTPVERLRTALIADLSPIDAWLADTAEDPARAAEDWAYKRPAALRTGAMWDAVQMPLGLATMAKARLEERGEFTGPLLAAGVDNVAWWLIPSGNAAAFASLPAQVCVLSGGRELSAPQPGRYSGDRTWLIPPRAAKPAHPVRLTTAAALSRAVKNALPSRRQRQRHP